MSRYSVTLRATLTVDVDAPDEQEARLVAEGAVRRNALHIVPDWEADEVARVDR